MSSAREQKGSDKMGKTAIMFAGQGSQHTGMGKDLYEEFEEFRNVFDNLDIGFDIKETCFENPDNLLSQTEYTQPCMVAFACGVTQILKRNGFSADYACGLSLGEYSALHFAGVWNCNSAVKIATFRGKVMAEASEGIETGMCAIMGAPLNSVEEYCQKAQDKGIVSVSNLNCPGQIVISGNASAVDAVVKMAKQDGVKRCIPLDVSGPFHTSIMHLAGEKLKKYFSTITFEKPQITVLYNCLGGPEENNDKITDLLVRQIQECVRMEDMIRYLFDHGTDRFVEVGPGKALSGFISKTAKDMGIGKEEYQVISLENSEEIRNTCKAVKG